MRVNEKASGDERLGAGKMQKPINTRYKIAATEQYLAFLFPLKSAAPHNLFMNKLLKNYLNTKKTTVFVLLLKPKT